MAFLRFCEPFYMSYGFVLYNEKNCEVMNKRLYSLLDRLYEVKWVEIEKYLDGKFVKYHDNGNLMSPFRSFLIFDGKDCCEFINWVESICSFREEVFWLKYYVELKEIINSCKFVNNRIHHIQPKISFY